MQYFNDSNSRQEDSWTDNIVQLAGQWRKPRWSGARYRHRQGSSPEEKVKY
jgi:hypothetical protein